MKRYRIEVNGKVYEVKVEEIKEIPSPAPAPASIPSLAVKSAPKPVESLKLEPPKVEPLRIEPPKVEAKPVPKAEESTPPADGGILSPMQGTVVQVKVKAGDVVKKGDVIAIIEAMKMENDVRSHRSGVVKAVHVTVGQTVSPNTLLAVIE
ncbi:MAG: biotin/lipoyl-containing protein [Methanocellales archaeon]